jgi:cytoskeletal protein CcmA (bactofilin family)
MWRTAMLMKRNLAFPAIRLNLGIAFNAVTSRLGGREGSEAMKPELQRIEPRVISWASQSGKLDGVAELSSATKQDSILAKGTEIIGTLFFEGPVVIDGHVEGEITGQDKITVGENGFVTANKISAASIVITGAVKVNTIASRRIEILPTGKVWGDLASPVLSIHEGARFEGQAFAREAQGTPEDSKVPPGESGG